MLAFTISSVKFYKRFIKSSYLILCCEAQYGTAEYSICFSNKETIKKLMSAKKPCILKCVKGKTQANLEIFLSGI